MHDLVRVRVERDDKSVVEFNIGRKLAEARGLEVIDSPTHRLNGQPRPFTRLNDRPAKPKKSVDELAAEKGTQTPAATATEEAATPADSTTTPPSEEN